MFKKLHLSLRKFVAGAVVVLSVTAAYLYAFPSPTLTYAAAILLHAGLGLIAAVCLLLFCRRQLKGQPLMAELGWVLVTLGAILGTAL
ncbi:MAG TPA: hypothetical protein VI685_06150, partial [Candidatus Angelobacter sp.]